MKQTQQIFDHFWIEAQKMKLIEEMAELTAELAKILNVLLTTAKRLEAMKTRH
jgi:hypothetical protein